MLGINGTKFLTHSQSKVCPPDAYEINANARFLVGEKNGQAIDAYVKTLRTARSVDAMGMVTPVAPGSVNMLTVDAIRNADSIEAYLGGRYYFRGISYTEKQPIKFYAGGEIGFLSVRDSFDDVAQRHKLSVGALVFGGLFEGSFVDIGIGVSDIFEENDNRFRGTVRLNARNTLLSLFGQDTDLFIESEVDADFGSGSDSIQTRLGFSIPIGRAPAKENKETDAVEEK